MTEKKVLVNFSLLVKANDMLYKAVQIVTEINTHFLFNETMSKKEMLSIIKSLKKAPEGEEEQNGN